jgi:1-acyl-sn-glycerol-3-phosphate acyltransferase
MKVCAERAKQGFTIGAFPEGTRRRTPSVGKEHLMTFKKGTFHLIKSLSKEGITVDIAPFCIIGARTAWPTGQSLPTPDAKITLKFLPHIRVDEDQNLDELLEETRSAIGAGIEAAARNDKMEYDVNKAFNDGVEVELKRELLFEAILLCLPPIITAYLGLCGSL